MKNLIAIHLLLMAQWVIAGQPFVTVGSDGNCDFSSISSAIDNGLSNEIRIATNGSPYNEHLALDDVSKILRGGYANCTDALINITDLSHAIIDGSDTGTVVAITGSDNESTVELRHLFIGNADYGITMNQGAKVDLILHDVLNFNNNIKGIQSTAGTVNMTISDTTITNNNSGGISCQGANSTITLLGETVISDNNSVANGAGISLFDGCDGQIFSPVEISNNSTIGSGGGINVKSSSMLQIFGYFQNCQDGFCYGVDDASVMIRNNQAAGDGGGIFVESGSSSVFMINVVMENNSAVNGGAIRVTDQAQLLSGSFYNDESCWNPGKCNQFINNKATSGGVFAVDGGAQAEIRSSWIKNNRADNGVVADVNTNGALIINNSFVVENGSNGNNGYDDNELFRMEGSLTFDMTSTRLEFMTIADNQVTEEMIENDGAAIALHSSIVADSVPINNSMNETSSQFECLIVHETNSFSAGATVTIDDAEFANAGNDDYHLKTTSPAIDYCYQIDNVSLLDADFESHGFDDPDKTNLHGGFDLGADEYIVDNDLIYANGFEEL